MDRDRLIKPIIGSDTLNGALAKSVALFMLQMPITVLGWLRFTIQNNIISLLTLVMIFMTCRSVSTLYDYSQ